MRARNAAIAQAEREEAAQLRDNKYIVAAMMHCSPSMRCRKDGGAVGSECAVCIEDLAEDDTYRRLPCGHFFHPQCVDPWLENNVTCPMCNVSLIESSDELDLRAAKETVARNKLIFAERARRKSLTMV
jgi:hypothetical protein